MPRRFGIDWEDGTLEAAVHLACAKHWWEPKFKAGNLWHPAEHLLAACKILFTDDEFRISKWTEDHAVDFTESDFCITWAGAASSKSNDFGLFSLLSWITDPKDTLVILASTDKKMLELRSYESVMRYFRILKRNRQIHMPFKESKQAMAIINDDDPDADDGQGDSTPKASVRGVAVAQGTDAEATQKLAGAHLPYVILLLDEMSAMRRAAANARTNLSIGTKRFQFFGLANPLGYLDLSAEHAEPIGGWQSVDVDTGVWETRFGRVRHHDGLKSPGILYPDKFPHLISQAQIDKILREERGNVDAPRVWNQIRGFPQKQGDVLTILTEQDITLFGAMDPATADTRLTTGEQRLITVGGLDPALTSTGDACVLQLATIMPVKVGIWVVGLHEPIYVPIMASGNRPQVYQIADYVLRQLLIHNLPLEYLCVDDSGTQSVADVLDVELGGHCMRAQFGGSATDKAISAINPIPAKERFKNHATEIWALTAEFVKSRQLKGLSIAASKQLTTRRYKIGSGTKQLESKIDYKKRMHDTKSPDEGDAVALCCRAVRDILGWMPGSAWSGALALPAATQSAYQLRDGLMVKPQQQRLKLTSSYLDGGKISGYTSGNRV